MKLSYLPLSVFMVLLGMKGTNSFSIGSPLVMTHITSDSSLFLSSSSASNDIDSLNLTPELKKMTLAFSSIPDEKLRYKQLLYMAGQLKQMDPSLMIPENKVPGCQSTVYVDCTPEKKMNQETGKEEIVLNYVGDSDGLLTKGLVALLVRGLAGCTPEQIQKVSPDFIKEAKITQSLTPGRNNGFLNMLAVMKAKASKYAEESLSKEEESSSAGDDTVESSMGIITSFEPVQGKPMYNAMMESLLKLKPTKLELVDNSDQHAGHAGSKGWEESGESHFQLDIVAEAFDGLPLVKRHQLIYLIIGPTMEKIHALQINAKTPSEVAK
jgi:sulfur transfer protein SufE/stress-induced morphogen